MNRLIGVGTHDFRLGKRIGKLHLAYAGAKTFCGSVERRGVMRVETGDYLSKRWIASHSDVVCQICAKRI